MHYCSPFASVYMIYLACILLLIMYINCILLLWLAGINYRYLMLIVAFMFDLL